MSVKCNGPFVSERLISISGSIRLIHWGRKNLFWCQCMCWATNHPLQDNDCPVCLFCISPPVPTRAQDMACRIASRCQKLKVHGKGEKRFQRKILFPDHQAIAEALGPSSLDEEERSGPGQCHGPEWGPKDGVPYPVAQYANSNI